MVAAPFVSVNLSHLLTSFLLKNEEMCKLLVVHAALLKQLYNEKASKAEKF